ncbi:hypothetical protein [Tomitella cavernea]|uniref:hypothetical protein n=1 Tax=Tomitella cavernea TaxID=1387982 RepID=UPI001903078D|nr:hypothetical protein [Tomitella cavernea]
MRSDFITGTSVSARKGVRRTPSQIRTHLSNTLSNDEALAALQEPEVRRRAVAGCTAVIWDGSDTRIIRLDALAGVARGGALPVRRLGSHMQARSNLMLHTTRSSGRPAVVWAESKLEELWMIALDRRADVTGYQSQPCILVWPIGTKKILQIPDLLITTDSGIEIASVRSESLLNDYARAMLADLMPDTLGAHGIDYTLRGSMPRQHAVNLRLLGALRWKCPVTREEW